MYTNVSIVGGKPHQSRIKITISLLYQLYPILACLKLSITYGKPSEQKIEGPVESQTGVNPLFIDILNHVDFERLYFFGALNFWDLIRSSRNNQFKADVHSQINCIGFPYILRDSDNHS